MRKIIVSEFLTLDGVMQAPGGKEEDSSGGFKYGGWQMKYFDDVFSKVIVNGINSAGGFILGRKTYEIFAGYWPTAPVEEQAVAKPLNNRPKYVVSKSLSSPLTWKNSVLINGNVAKEITKLKKQPGKDLMVIGSGNLVQTLIQHNLVDEYALMIHPLVLGSGEQLFRKGVKKHELTLLDSKTSSKGVIFLRYKNNKD